MSIDLPAIRERADVYLDARETQGRYNCPVTAAESADDVPILISEVERLRVLLRNANSAIVQLSSHDTQRLREWIEQPNGSLTTELDATGAPKRALTFESVEGGSIWVRMRSGPEEATR